MLTSMHHPDAICMPRWPRPDALEHRRRSLRLQKQQARRDAEAAQSERDRDRKRKRQARCSEDFASAEREHDRRRKRQVRQDEVARSVERVRDKRRKQQTRHARCPSSNRPAHSRYEVHAASDSPHTAGGRCIHCGAALLQEEIISTRGCPLVTPCCGNGKVRTPLPELSEDYVALVNHAKWPQLARSVNHACNFVTTLVLPQRAAGGRGFHEPVAPPCLLNLHGRVTHWLRPISSDLQNVNTDIEQWWMTPEELDSALDDERNQLITYLRALLERDNPVTRELVRACELHRSNDHHYVALKFQFGDAGPEVSAVYHTQDPDNRPPQLIMLAFPKNAPTQARRLRHGEVDALTFPALFPTGRGAYNDDAKTTTNRKLTRAMHTRYLMYNEDKLPQFLRSSRLVQEWLLHTWNEIETERLAFFYNAADRDTLHSITAAELAQDAHAEGRPSHIPAQFTGGPRFFQEKMAETLTRAAVFGTQNLLFVTVTASTQWDFLNTCNIMHKRPAFDAFFAFTRVFEAIHRQIFEDLRAGKYCPSAVRRIADFALSVHEWQKRAIPHTHTITHYPGEPWSAKQIDEIMWTHLPTAEEEARYQRNYRCSLTALVRGFMIHHHSERCGGLVGRCCWGFPQRLVEATYCDDSGRWVTWRRRGDENVVAYNPDLLCEARCHVCFIATSGTAAVGYLLQYPFKGDANARAAIAEAREDAETTGRKVDEVQLYQTHRCISASEAAFRIQEHNLVVAFPPVRSTRVVLPGDQKVYFNPKTKTAKQALDEYQSDTDKWFARPVECEDVSFARYFHEYTVTKRQPAASTVYWIDAFGNFVHKCPGADRHIVRLEPARFNTETFHARLLLQQDDCRARSWEALKTVDGRQCTTFAEAARELGLLNDEQTARLALAEALNSQLATPRRARVLLLAVLGAFECDANRLIDDFFDHFIELDWKHETRERCRHLLLLDLQRRLHAQNQSLSDYGLPEQHLPDEPPPTIDARYLPANVTLLPDQRDVFDVVNRHLQLQHPDAPLFLHVEGEAGGGKSFELNVLLNHARNLERATIAGAFPAKVALQFAGGQTLHYWFGLRPSNPGEDIIVDAYMPPLPPALPTRAQARGKILREARLIFGDEITMMRSDELDALVDKLDELGFRGVFLIVGNCAQLGAVMPGKGIAEQIAYSLQRSRHWTRFVHLRLTGQMRCHDDELRRAIHAIGYGEWPTLDGRSHYEAPLAKIRLPYHLFPAKPATPENILAARLWAHGDVSVPLAHKTMTASITCATNALADEHNHALLDQLQGAQHVYHARDIVKPAEGVNDVHAVHLSTDATRLLHASGVPPADLRLKVGAPVHLMLTIDKTEHLVKGALAVVVELNRHTVAIRLMDPPAPDRDIWHVPSVSFKFRPAHLPVDITRHQKPLRLAWASTVHRNQGDTLQRIVVDLRHPFFAHGQLYVASSRGRARDDTLYLVDPDDMHEDGFDVVNVVVPQLLFTDDLTLADATSALPPI